MSMKKTHKQFYEEILATLTNEEHKEFIKGRIEALNKKSADRKPTAEQEKRKELCDKVLDFMKPSTLYTVTELMRSVPELVAMPSVTFQYVNAIVRDLKDNGFVERVVEKGTAYFRKM